MSVHLFSCGYLKNKHPGETKVIRETNALGIQIKEILNRRF